MEGNQIAYWSNWIENGGERLEIKGTSHIVVFSEINMYSGDELQFLMPCDGKDKLFGFLETVAVPSQAITRLSGVKKNRIVFDVISYDDAITALESCEDSKFVTKEYIINLFNETYDKIEEIKNSGSYIDELRKIVNEFLNDCKIEEGILLTLDVHKNCKSLGLDMLETYRSQGMLDYLEGSFNLKEKEIIEVFNNIDENKFMLNRLEDFIVNNLGLI